MTPHTAVNCRVQAMHSTHCLYMKLRCYIISMVTPLALAVTVGLAKGREKGCTVSLPNCVGYHYQRWSHALHWLMIIKWYWKHWIINNNILTPNTFMHWVTCGRIHMYLKKHSTFKKHSNNYLLYITFVCSYNFLCVNINKVSRSWFYILWKKNIFLK